MRLAATSTLALWALGSTSTVLAQIPVASPAVSVPPVGLPAPTPAPAPISPATGGSVTTPFAAGPVATVTRPATIANPSTVPAAPAGATCGSNAWTYVNSTAGLRSAIPAGCTTFLGSLSLSGAGITDLSALSTIQSIQLSVDIASTGLTDLTGLTGLKTIGENFFVHDNPNLINVGGVSSLTTVGGGILIYQNPKLVSVSGLASLKGINPDRSPKYQFGISIYGNPLLASLDGLQSLSSVGNYLDLHNNTRMTSIKSLPTSGSFPVPFLRVSALPALDSLAPLSVYTSTANGSAVDISMNDQITTLAGLAGFTKISNLTIAHNAMLADVTALGNSTITGPVLVDDNTKLCDLSAIKATAGVKATCGQKQQVTGSGQGSAGGNNALAQNAATSLSGLPVAVAAVLGAAAAILPF
ncbi:uncharacterized protein EV422DRAFT_356201 [Fimicolochytrium jonesii]|uniref:uncharacterized protein n=1 Tax=Fimicolochytrium jonesii TaxID=1396493 RepID=UPI0022FEF459|nr:uncharacterized protein EV422DRAFT_356201 [Fimicolochytrium jonesii]KAI8823460.1 hypothetical protein EV422DRAFT_356201 [Fimicolochytrium jonesii]